MKHRLLNDHTPDAIMDVQSSTTVFYREFRLSLAPSIAPAEASWSGFLLSNSHIVDRTGACLSQDIRQKVEDLCFLPSRIQERSPVHTGKSLEYMYIEFRTDWRLAAAALQRRKLTFYRPAFAPIQSQIIPPLQILSFGPSVAELKLQWIEEYMGILVRDYDDLFIRVSDVRVALLQEPAFQVTGDINEPLNICLKSLKAQNPNLLHIKPLEITQTLDEVSSIQLTCVSTALCPLRNAVFETDPLPYATIKVSNLLVNISAERGISLPDFGLLRELSPRIVFQWALAVLDVPRG